MNIHYSIYIRISPPSLLLLAAISLDFTSSFSNIWQLVTAHRLYPSVMLTQHWLNSLLIYKLHRSVLVLPLGDGSSSHKSSFAIQKKLCQGLTAVSSMFEIKFTLLFWIYLSWLVVVGFWSLKKQINENKILKTLEVAKSATNGTFVHART